MTRGKCSYCNMRRQVYRTYRERPECEACRHMRERRQARERAAAIELQRIVDVVNVERTGIGREPYLYPYSIHFSGPPATWCGYTVQRAGQGLVKVGDVVVAWDRLETLSGLRDCYGAQIPLHPQHSETIGRVRSADGFVVRVGNDSCGFIWSELDALLAMRAEL